MIAKGINVEDRKKIIHYIIDIFNFLIADTCQKYPILTHVDLRGVVQKNEWHDELHPNNNGFERVSDAFFKNPVANLYD